MFWKLVWTKSWEVSNASSSEVSRSFSFETLSGELETSPVLLFPVVLVVRLLLKSVWYIESPLEQLLEPSLVPSFPPLAKMSAASEFSRICLCNGSSSSARVLGLLVQMF